MLKINIIRVLKDTVRSILKAINLRLHFKLISYESSRLPYLKLIENLGINLIFDIGANDGQWGLFVLRDGYRGKMISFEPTSNVYKVLKKNTRKYPNWKAHEQVAIGERCGEVTINVSGNSAGSSSILEMGKLHLDSAPNSKYVGAEIVKLVTLDTIFEDYFTKGDKCFLKIDVQGYEDQVLQGAINSIKEIAAVKIECSIASLYEGDKTFEHYFQFFKQNGFELFDMEPAFSNPVTGQLLQFDALFVRA